MVNQIMLVGSIASVPRFFDAPEDSAAVKTLTFDVDTGGTHRFHCEAYEENARRGHEDDGLERGDLIWVLGRIESYPVVDNDMEYRGRHVYVVVEDYTYLTNWAKQKIQELPSAN